MSIFVAKSFTKTLTNFLINGIIYMSIIFWRILMKEKFKSWAFSKEHGKCDVITLIIYLLGVCTVSFFTNRGLMKLNHGRLHVREL